MYNGSDSNDSEVSMKIYHYWLTGLMLITALLFFFGETREGTPDGKYHPKTPAHSQTSTVTVLNPALFHRLNTILEHGLIQGD